MIDGNQLDPQLASVLGSVLGSDPCSTAGEFRYSLSERRWEWSAELARMLGYEPGTVEPTTELLLSHQHPDDRAGVEEIIRKVVECGSRHRIIDTAGEVREVIVIGDCEPTTTAP